MDATCPNLRRLLPSCFAASWVLRTNDVTPKEMLFRFWLSFGVTLVGIDRGILFIIFFSFLLAMKMETKEENTP